MVALPEDTLVPAQRGNWLRLLGGFRLELAGAPVNVPVNGQRLLAYLGIRGSAPRADVAGTLWPEVSERNAYGSLRTTMWRIHRCGVEVVETVGGSLTVSADVTVDTHVFARTAQGVIRRDSGLDQPGALSACHDSELLPGWYDDWVIFERERLRQLRLHSLEALAERLTERRLFAAALDTALEAIQLEPLRESAHRVVIGIHLAEGNVVEAIRHFRFVSRLLADELGVQPSRMLADLMP